MIRVPHRELSAEALNGVIDAFILREGTDYGHDEYDIESKRQRVRRQLETGRAGIFYHPEEDFVDLQLIQD